jgi:hypothetical protein
MEPARQSLAFPMVGTERILFCSGGRLFKVTEKHKVNLGWRWQSGSNNKEDFQSTEKNIWDYIFSSYFCGNNSKDVN